MSINYPDHPFWNFSIKIYAGKGVSQACINIQERHQMDVNLLLLSTWYGASGRGLLSSDQLTKVIEITSKWNKEIVCRLRSVRTQLRDGIKDFPMKQTDEIRKAALSMEVECEHIEQLAVAQCLGDHALGPDKLTFGRIEESVDNIYCYFSLKKVYPTDDDLNDLSVILMSAYPSENENNVREVLTKSRFNFNENLL